MHKYKIEGGKETDQIVQNSVVALNASIRETKNNQQVRLKYEAINDWENASHLACLREILDKWNIDIEMSYKDYAQQQHDRIYAMQINDEGAIKQMNDDLAQAQQLVQMKTALTYKTNTICLGHKHINIDAQKSCEICPKLSGFLNVVSYCLILVLKDTLNDQNNQLGCGD
ncbi:MAG: hypothetical protein EZS28_025528 [Streblomastix strix]|uniref:Uncharacterized protein n=1 Tax=Streblomastix strix TaxID=222440 RepID=A0A5J4V8X6_9EUKA|nr:MAG: hypothetical protein EZS28_025528 [Streblomastix strix]